MTSASGATLGSSQTAAPGDTITLTVTGLDPTVLSNASRLAVTEGGVNIATFALQAASDGSGAVQIQFALAASVTGNQVPIVVSVDGDWSMPVYINVAAPASAS